MNWTHAGFQGVSFSVVMRWSFRNSGVKEVLDHPISKHKWSLNDLSYAISIVCNLYIPTMYCMYIYSTYIHHFVSYCMCYSIVKTWYWGMVIHPIMRTFLVWVYIPTDWWHMQWRPLVMVWCAYWVLGTPNHWMVNTNISICGPNGPCILMYFDGLKTNDSSIKVRNRRYYRHL